MMRGPLHEGARRRDGRERGGRKKRGAPSASPLGALVPACEPRGGAERGLLIKSPGGRRPDEEGSDSERQRPRGRASA